MVEAKIITPADVSVALTSVFSDVVRSPKPYDRVAFSTLMPYVVVILACVPGNDVRFGEREYSVNSLEPSLSVVVGALLRRLV